MVHHTATVHVKMNGTFLYPKIFNRPQFRQMARCFFRNSIGPFVLLGRVMYNKKTIQKGGSRLDKRMYLSIDLKSFYASVECLEHGLDPMTTNLVVADAGCTEKTICLAISPSLKSCGIPGRARLFKVKQAGQRAAAAI